MTDSQTAATQVGLLEAISRALQVLDAHKGEDEALRDSFRAAARGVGAERSFLARVNPRGDVTEVLEAHGIGTREINALRSGRSSPGVSVSVVRQALRTGRAQHVEDTRLVTGDLERTGALAGGEWSVVCVPVIDPHTHATLAILYFQTHSLTRPLGAPVVPHVQAYATTLAQVWYTWRRVQNELASARNQGGGDAQLEIIGEAPSTAELRAHLHQVILPAISTPTPDPVLILGPTGVGKDLVARYLHAFSARAQGPYITVNCASLRGDLVEKEMFGHVAGAYTGAVGEATGQFVLAHGGVLFLDEVGDMPPEGQALLLRAIETRRVRPVGAREQRPIDVQIVCATNVDLDQAVAERRFRSDLYHRIRGLTLYVPPLAERPGDVLPLLSHYLAYHERRYRKRTLGLAPETLATLLRYSWPGNVRELAAVCSTLVAHTDAGRWITRDALRKARPEIEAAVAKLPPEKSLEEVVEQPYQSLREALRALERAYLVRVGDALGWNRTVMAQRLRLDRKSLYRRLRRTGLHDVGEREDDPAPAGDSSAGSVTEPTGGSVGESLDLEDDHDEPR